MKNYHWIAVLLLLVSFSTVNTGEKRGFEKDLSVFNGRFMDESSSSAAATKLRHARHSRNNNNNPYSYPDNNIDDNPNSFTYGQPYNANPTPNVGNTRLTIQDNHKPVFTNCSSYQPTIKEEQPTSTFVFRVQAVDKDPIENGGNITYTFVSAPGERVKFSIDPKSGNVTTKHMFDRDEPAREKEIYLTVRATDNGKPQLDDACTVKVTIEDINDNTPTFDKVSYMESVPQDLQPNKEVMRISATDLDDGNNSIVVYDIEPKKSSEQKYFRIDHATGIIYLNKNIDKDPGYKFKLRATATDQGEIPNSAYMDLEILVVESHKKAPSFTSIPQSPIMLPENYSDFSSSIATLTAVSNTDEKNPVFELVTGKKEQANKLNTFRLESEGNTAFIRLARPLDYELVSEYMLTIRIQNKYNLAAETSIGIQVEDVNDNMPLFVDVTSGSVSENEPIGTPVMQVKAIDHDATSAHNQVTYELADNQEYFAIDPYTGNITTRVTFDREQRDAYNVKVYAIDNSPSALYKNDQHNKGEQVFHINIADKNDHPPKFTQEVYVATNIPENANINFLVTQVKALDNDTASPVTYSIEEGNTYNAFLIEPLTGKIRVNNALDYENITSYTLKIRAFDGAYEDYCRVEIKLENVNDNPPVFLPYKGNITIPEEKLVPGCIAELQAYDPDIPDRNAEQHIMYYIVKTDQQNLLTIDKSGCLSLKERLDRDPPNGFEIWQVLIAANDEDGPSLHSLQSTTEVVITLTDINDNGPILTVPQPVVWRENQGPGIITRLTADDNDGPENGPPFSFHIPMDAPPIVQSKFRIIGSDFEATDRFDREEQKEYFVPIAITDSGSPPMTNISILHVIIGDENDNAMKPGESSIFVYNYKGMSPDSEIGQVYVDDPDDWDLPDKSFHWANGIPHPNFNLNTVTGMITMLQGILEGTYILTFNVSEEARKIPFHTVSAIVNVTVKEIPEEAVDKSGSIRFRGISAENFVSKNQNGESKATILRTQIASALNISEENVDVFTILRSPLHLEKELLLDVRFSAHGSPYYAPERINSAINRHQEEFQSALNLQMLMINIDECLVERLHCSEGPCYNVLKKSNVPAPVYTNTTSFVGISAIVDTRCECIVPPPICLNGGSLIGDRCQCTEGYDGPNCELTAIGFAGDGWALYPPLQSCDDSHLTVHLQTDREEGLILYIGPDSVTPSPLGVQDFMSLQLRKGYVVLYVDYGNGTSMLENKRIKVSNGELHKIDVLLTKTSIELQVDDCKSYECMKIAAPLGGSKFLNVNGPLQVGGTYVDISRVGFYRNWTYKPSAIGFVGCIRNLTYNNQMYNLGIPSISKNVDPGCSKSTAVAVTFGFNWNYLLLFLILLLVATVLLLAVMAHQRKADDLYKDTDDIRENIINYEDEGGGEGDMTGYDLNVLRLMYDGPVNEKMQNGPLPSTGPNEVPDICGFLDGRKHTVDNDPEATPFDDVRHYAYEGDGNTTGSLSSLASGTDEGDLNFDYLSNFGPRFRKLADMYGEDGSDEESETYHNATSESWC